MSDAFWGLTDQATFMRVVKTVADFEVVETIGGEVGFGGGGFGVGPFDSSIGQKGIFDGILQPVPSQKIQVKPEGQRTWKWWSLWTVLALNLDDIIACSDGRKFRVMSVSDWQAGGYYAYELVEGFLVS